MSDKPTALTSTSEAIAPATSFHDAIAKRLESSAELVAPLVKKRRWMVGFGPAVIPPYSFADVQSQPRCVFEGKKLINCGDSTGLYLEGLFVGNKPQLPAYISVAKFNGPEGKDIDMDSCDPAVFITFQIQNASATTATWMMTLIGEVVL